MVIKNADSGDLQGILDLQYLAFQREAIQYNDLMIAPLKQTIDDIKNEY